MLIGIEDMLFTYLPKILLAIFCGSLIGLERELKDKPAGIKTYMLICAGATLFTMVGIAFAEFYQPAGEPSRIAAQVVTGVGFLGAGTIIFARGHIKGLTSAAAMWMSAAIGMAIAIEFYVFSVVVTLVIILSLILLGHVEEGLGLRGRRNYHIYVDISEPAGVNMLMKLVEGSRGRCKIEELEKKEQLTIIKLKCDLSAKELTNFQKALMKLGDKVSFKVE